MSVINSMLRDLDRRHAPMPINANVQPTLAPPKRIAPRSALALSMLIILVILSWSQHFKKAAESVLPLTVNGDSTQSGIKTTDEQPAKIEKANASMPMENSEPSNRRLDPSLATTRHEPIHGGSESASMPPTVAANEEPNRLASQKASSPEKHHPQELGAQESATASETKNPASIIKQERQSVEDLIAERYQLARNALAQNQPERAYDLLRENPPSLISNTDYHAVLAAVEQQLKHFSDASLRYQQLLTVDQNQASWWLGLALSLEGQQRNIDALGAYRHALSLNSLPDAARQYAAARIAALSHSAE